MLALLWKPTFTVYVGELLFNLSIIHYNTITIIHTISVNIHQVLKLCTTEVSIYAVKSQTRVECISLSEGHGHGY